MEESGLTPLGTSLRTTIITRPAQTTTETPAHSPGRSFNGIVSERTIEPINVSEYEELNKSPYLVEYFGLKDVSKMPSIERYGTELDGYIKSEIERLHLDNSFGAYSGIIKELEKTLKINPHERPDYRLQKVAQWVKRVILPQRKLDDIKKKLYG